MLLLKTINLFNKNPIDKVRNKIPKSSILTIFFCNTLNNTEAVKNKKIEFNINNL